MMDSTQKIIIGTRASPLALWQANHVKALLETHFSVQVELTKISTKGDQIQDRSLMEIGGKGLFLKEIEDALIAGEVDIAVHSMKDVPFDLPEGLILGAILQREDPSDAFVSEEYADISDLPAGAVVGTSSIRRLTQLQKQHPKLIFEALRGNVDTRLRKLQDGHFDAIVLASAGLIRLGLSQHIRHRLNIVGAVGQGAVGIEYRKDRQDVKDMLLKLNHDKTWTEVNWERYFSRRLQGSCQTPLGCFVQRQSEDQFDVQCFFATVDGAKSLNEKFNCSGAMLQKNLDIIVQKISLLQA